MTQRISDHLPKNLRPRLEAARLDLLALFRALDRLSLGPDEAPQEELQALFELDADFAEALVVLDWPVGEIQLPSMLRDTLASLDRLRHAGQPHQQARPAYGQRSERAADHHPRLARSEGRVQQHPRRLATYASHQPR